MKMIKVLDNEMPIQDKAFLSKSPGRETAFKTEPINGMG
jgi:hypothetical protein